MEFYSSEINRSRSHPAQQEEVIAPEEECEAEGLAYNGSGEREKSGSWRRYGCLGRIVGGHHCAEVTPSAVSVMVWPSAGKSVLAKIRCAAANALFACFSGQWMSANRSTPAAWAIVAA